MSSTTWLIPGKVLNGMWVKSKANPINTVCMFCHTTSKLVSLELGCQEKKYLIVCCLTCLSVRNIQLKTESQQLELPFECAGLIESKQNPDIPPSETITKGQLESP